MLFTLTQLVSDGCWVFSTSGPFSFDARHLVSSWLVVPLWTNLSTYCSINTYSLTHTVKEKETHWGAIGHQWMLAVAAHQHTVRDRREKGKEGRKESEKRPKEIFPSKENNFPKWEHNFDSHRRQVLTGRPSSLSGPSSLWLFGREKREERRGKRRERKAEHMRTSQSVFIDVFCLESPPSLCSFAG